MAYYPDLSPYEYWWRSSEAEFGRLPIVNVGWMEHPHPLPTGEVPAGFAERLMAFCARERLVHMLMGVQGCDFCKGSPGKAPWGNGEIRVLGRGVVYAAPTLIGHYVVAHGYRPPQEFIEAVLEGPAPDAREHVRYRFAVLEAMVHDFWKELPKRGAPPMRPGKAPGSVLGPLVLRMRIHHVAPGVALVAASVAYVEPWLALGLLLALAALVGFTRRTLLCPVCRKRMAWPLREPPRWSRPPRSVWDHPFGTIFCDDCDIALRDSGDWRAIGDVVPR